MSTHCILYPSWPHPKDHTHLPSDTPELGRLPYVIFLEDTRHHIIVSLTACMHAGRMVREQK